MEVRLDRSVSRLKHLATNLLERVAACLALLPYSVRFLSRVLFVALRRAGAGEKEALKVGERNKTQVYT